MRNDPPEGAGAVKTSRFASSLMDLLERVEYRRVSLDKPTDPVFRLRYEAYQREGFIDSNPQKIAGDAFDHTPNAMGFGVYVDGDLAASIRLHNVTPGERSSPSRLIYPDELNAILDAGLSYIDPSRFTTDHEMTLALPALPFLTLRIAAMACEYFSADYCLSSVRPEHAAFYKRVFGSVQMGPERYYPGLKFPVCLYAAQVGEIRNRVADRFPFFMSTPAERAAMFGPGSASRYVAMIRPTARSAALAERRFSPASHTAGAQT